MVPINAAFGEPPPDGGLQAAEPVRIKRAVGLPSASERAGGADPVQERNAAALQALSARHAGSGEGHRSAAYPPGSGARLFPLPGRKNAPGPTAAAAPGEEEAPLTGTAASLAHAAASGVAPSPRQPGTTASLFGYRPVLVAAAVAGAVLATVPFVGNRSGSTNYEGLGSPVPVASQNTDGAGHATPGADGEAGSLPLSDPADGSAHPVVPQPETGPPAWNHEAADPDKAKADHGHGTAHDESGHQRTALKGVAAEEPSRPGRGLHPATTAFDSYGPHAGDTESAKEAGAKSAAAVATESARTPDTLSVRAADSTPTKPAARAVSTSTAAHTSTAAKPAAAKPSSSGSKTAHSASAATSWSTRVIDSTYVLGPGESVASNRMRVTMQTGGNLVISDENGVIRWSSHTSGKGYKAVFQDDGHFVVYTKDSQTVWSSGTAGNPGATLVIQGDSNVVIASASGAVLWAAGTQH